MTLKPIWTEETQVKTYATDFRGQWKPVCFFRLMQEAAANHAAHLGVGYHDMLDHGMVWILSRVKIQFHHFPEVGEGATINTWPKGIQQKIFFMRDFEIMREDGLPLASATSAWLLVDIKERRFLPSQKLPGNLPDNEGRSALDETLERINHPDVMVEQFTIEPRYSSIDLLGHVNNTYYIEWILDCFETAVYQSRRLGWLQINFSNEIKPYEEISIASGNCSSNPLLNYIQGDNLTSGQRAFDAAVGWATLLPGDGQ